MHNLLSSFLWKSSVVDTGSSVVDTGSSVVDTGSSVVAPQIVDLDSFENLYPKKKST